MKNLKSIIAGAALLFACATSYADGGKKVQITQNDVINTYISDVSTGKTTDLDKMLAKDLQFNMVRGKNVNTLDKDQVIDALKTGTATAPVNTNSVVMQQDDNYTKYKVTFKYDGYTRTDVVTVSKLYGWQVTNVDSSYGN